MLKINYRETYQEFYLKKAINELKLNSDVKIEARAGNGKSANNYINNIKIPLIFPMYLLNYIDNIDKNKELDYNFIGVIFPSHRNWVKNKKYKKNSIIKESINGRDIEKKYQIDKEYYSIMCKSKFTLTPVGDCPWSYRFFEAIMCFSIPILDNNSKDIHMKEYFCFSDEEEHYYDLKKAIGNYNKFINSDHFLKNNKIIIDSIK